MLNRKLLILIVLLVIGGAFWRVWQQRSANTTDTPTSNQPAGFDKTRYSADKPESLWWIVNKNRPLPEGFEPNLVEPNIPIRPNAAGDERKISSVIVGPLQEMVAAAKTEGISLLLASGYRSYALQVSVYNQNVRNLGQAEADKVSAKPGTSEHQTGLSLDIGAASRTCEIQECFGQQPEGVWVRNHAPEYGFIIRYPEGKQASTGYNYEPWHLRYVGKDLARELQRTGQTMEEFFNP